MIIWRVQHLETGKGPYTTGGTLSDVLCSRHNYYSSSHPGPLRDGLGLLDPWEVCGMPTHYSLLQWFKGFETRLAKAGYEIIKVKSPRGSYRKGRKQVVYEPSEAIILAHRPIKAPRRTVE